MWWDAELTCKSQWCFHIPIQNIQNAYRHTPTHNNHKENSMNKTNQGDEGHLRGKLEERERLENRNKSYAHRVDKN